ncbi:hypothetical protein Scep_004592 [Stephania cephalantha]|uniref:Uncharacterized protein n=1 Tax=Stephania cephalantha TaxID=152367 RepID=A0AAP0PVK1_9MAGN
MVPMTGERRSGGAFFLSDRDGNRDDAMEESGVGCVNRDASDVLRFAISRGSRFASADELHTSHDQQLQEILRLLRAHVTQSLSAALVGPKSGRGDTLAERVVERSDRVHDEDSDLVMHRDKDMDLFHLDRDFNVSVWAYGQPGTAESETYACYCHDVALAYIDGRRQMVCSLLGGLGGAQLVTEEPSLSRRSPTLQSKMGVWPRASMALGWVAARSCGRTAARQRSAAAQRQAWRARLKQQRQQPTQARRQRLRRGRDGSAATNQRRRDATRRDAEKLQRRGRRAAEAPMCVMAGS